MRGHHDNTFTADDIDRLLGLLRRLVNDGPLDRLISVEEATDRLCVSRTALYGMFRDGVLTRRKVGRSVRVLESEMLAFMRKGEG